MAYKGGESPFVTASGIWSNLTDSFVLNSYGVGWLASGFPGHGGTPEVGPMGHAIRMGSGGYKLPIYQHHLRQLDLQAQLQFYVLSVPSGNSLLELSLYHDEAAGSGYIIRWGNAAVASSWGILRGKAGAFGWMNVKDGAGSASGTGVVDSSWYTVNGVYTVRATIEKISGTHVNIRVYLTDPLGVETLKVQVNDDGAQGGGGAGALIPDTNVNNSNRAAFGLGNDDWVRPVHFQWDSLNDWPVTGRLFQDSATTTQAVITWEAGAGANPPFTYQLQSSATQNGVYADIGGATASPVTYTIGASPWVRLKMTDNLGNIVYSPTRQLGTSPSDTEYYLSGPTLRGLSLFTGDAEIGSSFDGSGVSMSFRNVNSSVAFRTDAGTVKLRYRDTAVTVRIYRDAVLISTVAMGSTNSVLETASFGTGINGVFHEYVIQVNKRADSVFVPKAIVLAGGTLAQTTATKPASLMVCLNDSNGEGSQISPDYALLAWPHDLAPLLGMEECNGGISSDTEVESGSRGLEGRVTGHCFISPAPARIFLMMTTNDINNAAGAPDFTAIYNAWTRTVKLLRFFYPNATATKIYLVGVIPQSNTATYASAYATEHTKEQQVASEQAITWIDTDNVAVGHYLDALHMDATGQSLLATLIANATAVFIGGRRRLHRSRRLSGGRR